MQFDTTTFLIITGAITVLGTLILLRRYGVLNMNSSSKKSIMVLQPDSKRFFDLTILRETEKALESKRKGIYHRYYKSGPGWSGEKGTTRFIALEGNAYTAIVTDDKSIKTLRLPQALKILWGEAYNKVPAPQRQILENHVFGVTIKPDEIPLEDKSRAVAAENIDNDNIKIATEAFGKRLKKKGKMDWMTFLQGGGVVGFIVYILANLHYLPVVK